MSDKEWQKATIGQVVQFTENHKWCGALGFVSEVKNCGDDYRFMIGCTMPNNQTACDTAYIYSMLSKNEFEPLLDGHVVLMPKGEKNERRKHFIPRRSKIHRRGVYSHEDVTRRPPRQGADCNTEN